MKEETQATSEAVSTSKTEEAGKAAASGGDIGAADVARLTELLGEAAANELIELDAKIRADPKAKPQSHGLVKLPQLADRAARTAIHSVCNIHPTPLRSAS